MSNRHKWDGAFIGTSRDSGMASCVKCGCIKQFVAGKPTYFMKDTVYHKAGKCDPSNLEENNQRLMVHKKEY